MSKKRPKHDYKTLAYLMLVTQAGLLVIALCITVIFLAPNNFKKVLTKYRTCIRVSKAYQPNISAAELAQHCPKPR